MKTKKVGNRELPAKCFAYVGDPENPDTWHLPFLNPDGSVDATHLADAAAALSAGGFRGQKVDLPATAVAGVKAKLRAAYQKMGKKPAEMPEQLREAESPVSLAPGRLIEAVDDQGYEWLVCLIQAGLAKSGTFYPAEVLREAAPLFEGARAFDRSDQEHLTDQNMSVRNVVGWHDQVQFQEADGGRLVSHFHVAADAPWLATKMRDAWGRNKSVLPGFSIVADGKATLRRHEGRMVRYAEAITKVDAVDPVLKASAGGHVIRMIQAIGAGTGGGEEEMKFLEALIKMIEAERPELLSGKDKDNLKEEEVMTLFREAMKGKPPEKDPAKAKEQEKLLDQVEVRLKEAEKKATEAETRFQEAECRNLLTSKLAESKLPEITQAKIKKDFTARKIFTEADLDQAIKDERDYLASFHEATGLPGLGSAAVAGVAERDRILCALDGFFFDADLKVKDQLVPRFLSFKEAYITITGDKHLTGRFKEAVNLRHFVEAVDPAAWATILGEAIHKRLLADFNLPGMQLWRRVASDITPIQDFKTNTRMRYGGYGELPDVPRLGNYDELDTPGEEKGEFTIGKKGGLESLAMEDIANDDVGAIRRIPSKLARAAALGLNLAVFNPLINNSAIMGDTKALFHADHGNLGNSALNRTNLAAARVAMRKQVEPGSEVSLGLVPRLLLIPAELEEMAFMLCKAATTLVNKGTTEVSSMPNLFQGTDYEVVPWFIDATDWYCLDNSPGLATLEVGFYQGRQDPELFVQDLPNVGSMFTADKITYKIRFIFGLLYLDYRPWRKEVVAG